MKGVFQNGVPNPSASESPPMLVQNADYDIHLGFTELNFMGFAFFKNPQLILMEINDWEILF